MAIAICYTSGVLLATHQYSGSHYHADYANEQNLLDFLHKNSFAVFPAVLSYIQSIKTD
jgi:hypothetical protein